MSPSPVKIDLAEFEFAEVLKVRGTTTALILRRRTTGETVILSCIRRAA